MGLLILFHPFHLPPYLSHSVSSTLTFHFPSLRLSFTRKIIAWKSQRIERSGSFMFKRINPREGNDTEEKVGKTKQLVKMFVCRVPASLD